MMKTSRLVLGIVVTIGCAHLMGQTLQPATRPAAAPATSPAKLIWRGLDLSAAAATTQAAKLPDVWEERPPGSKSYEVRSDVTVIPARESGSPASAVIYWLPAAHRFYVQYDLGGSSTHHFYGPFDGDPAQILSPPTSRPAGR